MNLRERLEAFWTCQTPDQVPYAIYYNEWRHTQHDPAWLPMFDDGLGVTWHTDVIKKQPDSTVEIIEKEYEEQGKKCRRQTIRTPVGEVFALWEDGWQTRYHLNAPEDYRVLAYAVAHTAIAPDLVQIRRLWDSGPTWMVPLIFVGRTPFQTIHVDYAGLENISMHLFECPDEIRLLYDALLVNFRKTLEIAATAPGRFVSVLENFTSEMGPQRYAEFLAPVYQELFPALRAAGKCVGVHYDGRLASCQELIARQPVDLIESLTPPPEGDMSLAEARAAWPHLLLWHNLNVSQYQLPPKQLHDLVLESVRTASPDHRLFAFEVSEHIPQNWKESMPIVLRALRETRL